MAWTPFMCWVSPLKPCRHEPNLVFLPHPVQSGALQWAACTKPLLYPLGSCQRPQNWGPTLSQSHLQDAALCSALLFPPSTHGNPFVLQPQLGTPAVPPYSPLSFVFVLELFGPKKTPGMPTFPQRFPHLEGFFFSPPHSGCTNRSGTRPDGAPRAESYLGGDYDFPAALTQRRRHPRGSHHPSAAPRASVSTPTSRPLGMQQPTGSAGRCWRKHPRNDKWCRAVLYALYLTALSSFNLFYFSWKRVWGSSTRFSRDFSRSRSALTPPWRSGKQISFLVFVWKPGWKMISKLPKLETVLCFGGGGGERGGGEERSVSSHSNEERAQGARHCD